MGTIISYYRNTFSDYSFDKPVLDSISNLKPYDDSEIMLTFPQNQTIKRSGLGNRKDMIYWYFFNAFEPKEFRDPRPHIFHYCIILLEKLNMQKGLSEPLLKKLKLHHPYFALGPNTQTLESISVLSYLDMVGIGELEWLQDVIPN